MAGRSFRWAVAAAAGAVAVTCAAEVVETPASSPIHWRCWHSLAYADSISCHVAVAPETSAPELETPAATLAALRMSAALFEEHGLVLIPLYGPPVDWERVARLARASLCARRTGCSVEFSRLPPG